MRLDSLNPLSSLISTTMSVKSAVYCSLVVLASLVLAPEPVRSAQATLKDQGVKPTPFPVCIDDSDCSKLGQGTKYACFQVRKTLNSGKLIIFYEIVWIKRKIDALIAQLFQPQHSNYKNVILMVFYKKRKSSCNQRMNFLCKIRSRSGKL